MLGGAQRADTPGTARRNAGFDDVPEEYDRLRATGHMARRRADLLDRALQRTSGPVLEVGSGTGALLRDLAARSPARCFVGVEPLPGYVAYASERARSAGIGNVRFEVGCGEDLPGDVAPGPVGAVLTVDALHHVEDLARVCATVAAVAGDGARWFAMEPNRLHPYVWAYHRLTPGERTFATGGFVARARRAGWHLAGRRTLFLYPSGVRGVPPWAAALERRLEGVAPLAGAVLLELVRGPVSDARGR